MKKFFQHTAYFIASGIWWFLSLLPFWALYLLSDGLYLLMSHVVRYRHRVIWHNLRTSFPEKSEDELRQIEKNFYKWFCDYIVETVKLITMSKEQLLKRMTFTGVEKLNQYAAEGRSVGVYLGHLGNWEWITSLPYWTQNATCCQLYHPLENEYFDRLFRYVRERNGAYCIPMQESLRKILEFKKAKRPVIVGYISDQTPFWWNIHHWLTFLHHDTPVLTGAERIVKHTDQVFVYGDMKRVKRGHYNCEFKVLREDTKRAKPFEITDEYFRRMEQSIRQQPEIYLWSHNRWKRTRAIFDEHFEYVDGKVRLQKGKDMIW